MRFDLVENTVDFPVAEEEISLSCFWFAAEGITGSVWRAADSERRREFDPTRNLTQYEQYFH